MEARVLAAAAKALDAPREVNLWEQLYFSRRLRLGWAAAVAVLCLAHLGVALAPSATRNRSAPEELASPPLIAQLHQVELERLPISGALFGTHRARPEWPLHRIVFEEEVHGDLAHP